MSYVPDHVENPTAWLDAKARRIKANASKTRRAKLIAEIEANDSREFIAWLLDERPPQLDEITAEIDRARTDAAGEWDSPEVETLLVKRSQLESAWRKRVGWKPDGIREALDNWGGLTEKQLNWARTTFKKNVERAEARDANENARRASAPSWVEGRQTVSGAIQFVRCESSEIGYHTTFAVKAIVLLDDGRKCWTSLPRAFWSGHNDVETTLKGERITFTATFSPSNDDPTMAFGKRPTLAKASSAVESSKPTATPAEGAIVDSSASETPQQAKARRARERRERRKREQQ